MFNIVFLQDVVDDHRNFREYITHRLEQILRAENAYARFEFERSTYFDGKVDTFVFCTFNYLSQV